MTTKPLINIINCPFFKWFIRIKSSWFDYFNFSWKGDNTSNIFSVELINPQGIKIASSPISLLNTEWNTTGISLGTFGNISIINISVTNRTGTIGTSVFYVDNFRLINSTHNQSQYITMKASCTGNNYANATTLYPGEQINMCDVRSSTTSKFIWLFQDIINPFKGLAWTLQYNSSIITWHRK